MTRPMKFAICNELFENWDFARVCRYVKSVGYDGLEVAPFTLAPRITDVDKARRAELRRQAEAAGVQIIGLHWLLAGTEGFYLTSPDDAVRERDGEYLVDLAGSDARLRRRPDGVRIAEAAVAARGVEWEQAFDYATDTFRRAMPGIDANGVSLCMEPLAPAGDRLHQHRRRGRAADGGRRPSELRAAPRRQGDVERADADARHHPAVRDRAPATSTPTIRTAAARGSATSTSCRSSRR